jgi:hypothetical protein
VQRHLLSYDMATSTTAAGSQIALAAIAKITAIGTILAIRSNFRSGSGLTGIGASYRFVTQAFQKRIKD